MVAVVRGVERARRWGERAPRCGERWTERWWRWSGVGREGTEEGRKLGRKREVVTGEGGQGRCKVEWK